MRRRVVETAGDRGKAVVLGTFHAFCAQLLTELNPDLRTIEDVDHWILLRRNLPRLKLERYRHLAEPGQFLGDFLTFFLALPGRAGFARKNIRPTQTRLRDRYARDRASLADDERKPREEEVARQMEIARAYRESEAMLRERNLMTFGMQLMDTVVRLRNDAEHLAKLRARFRYILVDEFQDTNVAQLELLWLLGGEHRNLVVVGDHRQAIYRFRGASFGSFALFLDRYAGVEAAARERVQLPLRRNYRSVARILRVANRVEQNLSVPGEDLKGLRDASLVAEKHEGERIRIVTLSSSEEEARWVASEIERLHGAGARWRSMAVLYRMHTHREWLVEELKRRGIPFVIRNLSILNHRLVRDVVAYLRLIANERDDVACARALAAPAWGLAPEDLARLAERAAKSRGSSIWETLQAAQGELVRRGRPSKERGRISRAHRGFAEARAAHSRRRAAGRITGATRSGRRRGRGRPQVRRTVAQFRRRVAIEKRDRKIARVCGISGLFSSRPTGRSISKRNRGTRCS